MSRLAVFVALLLMLPSAPARADGFVTPFIGYNFGGESSTCVGLTDCSPSRTSYGVSIGAIGASVGFEEDLSYTKDFFGASPGAASSAFSAMSNLIFPGPPGRRLRSYIVSGVGRIRLHESLNQTSVDSTVTGYDVGGGLNGLFTKHLGIRIDVRHFQTFQDVNLPLASGKVGFWRASLGLALKF
jgi:Outer membrane protein beta-barrel domain